MTCAGSRGPGADVLTVDSPGAERERLVYWHRELPPREAEPMEEHIIEADSTRVSGTIVHSEELWERCRSDLMAHATDRLEQEIHRLGGHYAHVLDERIASKHDAGRGEAWLHGVFNYMLYR